MGEKQEEKKVSTRLSKKTEGYGYKYTELADINEYIESIGETYYQYPETAENGYDYIMTVRQKDGKDMPPIRGAKIVEAKLSGKQNPVQEYGASLTYARRYSLLLAYGLATEDDDAASLNNSQEQKPKQSEVKAIGQALGQAISDYGAAHNMTVAEIKKDYGIPKDAKVPVSKLREIYKDLTGEEYEG